MSRTRQAAFRLIALFPIFGSVLNLLPLSHWLLELNRSLSAHYLVLHCLGLLLLAIGLGRCSRSVRALLGACLVGMICFYSLQIGPYALPRVPGRCRSTETTLKLFLSNVMVNNENKIGLAEQIRSENPDVIFLVEV